MFLTLLKRWVQYRGQNGNGKGNGNKTVMEVMSYKPDIGLSG